MRSSPSEKVFLSVLGCYLQFTPSFAFTSPNPVNNAPAVPAEALISSSTSLGVSIGIGPDQAVEKGEEEEQKELVAGVDYEIPDHEAYRTSRRSKLDEQCDRWFGALLGDENTRGVLGELADEAREILTTPVPLVNEVELPTDHEEWTPYVATKLPWTPLTPAFGLEEFGLPVPRRNAETWRHFDVSGMVNQDYSGSCEKNGEVLELSDEEVKDYRTKLEKGGSWIPDDECQARLVYINGRFAPQLSMENDLAGNLAEIDESVSNDVKSYLSRLTDGFTDKLAVPVPIGQDIYESSYKKLGGADHAIGDATSQFAINTQQGTACFAALNTRRTGGVAYIRVPDDHENDVEERKPILLLNAVTKSGGAASDCDGMTMHPRALVVAGKNSKLSVVQASVDLDEGSDHIPKLYNGFTQMVINEGAEVSHSFLEESGGMVTPAVENSDLDYSEDEPSPRMVEAERPELQDTHLECVDVQCIGDDSRYEGTLMSVGGSGRIRVSHSVSLLKPRAHAKVYGFFLSGGAQRHDCKTNIHHAGQGTTSEQIQKNMIGGRATGAFRGRIRVEQSAQQTDSQQLSRTILLSDKSRAWSVPSLEIIADDVQCTHGTTVSDLSEEELFYLRSRGLDTALARNLLMYAFAADVCASVDPAMLTSVDSDKGLQKRLIERLNNVVPQGERAIKGEFQSV